MTTVTTVTLESITTTVLSAFQIRRAWVVVVVENFQEPAEGIGFVVPTLLKRVKTKSSFVIPWRGVVGGKLAII